MRCMLRYKTPLFKRGFCFYFVKFYVLLLTKILFEIGIKLPIIAVKIHSFYTLFWLENVPKVCELYF